MHVLGSSVRPVWYGVRGGRRPGAGAGGVLQGSYRVAPPAPPDFTKSESTYPGGPTLENRTACHRSLDLPWEQLPCR